MATEKRFIDASDCPCLKCDTKDYDCYTGYCEEFTGWRLSPLDAVEVVHGRWENFGEHRKMDLRCSVCNKRASNFVGGTEDWWDMWKPNYCPNCGADMRGDGNGT